MELQIGGIALIPVIFAAVEGLKRLGVPKDIAPWVTAGLSVVGYIGVLVVTDTPGYEKPIVMGLEMLIVFLAGTGLYVRTRGTK